MDEAHLRWRRNNREKQRNEIVSESLWHLVNPPIVSPTVTPDVLRVFSRLQLSTESSVHEVWHFATTTHRSNSGAVVSGLVVLSQSWCTEEPKCPTCIFFRHCPTGQSSSSFDEFLDGWSD